MVKDMNLNSNSIPGKNHQKLSMIFRMFEWCRRDPVAMMRMPIEGKRGRVSAGALIVIDIGQHKM